MAQDQTYRQYAIEEDIPREEPFYIPVSDEVELFEAAYARKIPVLLKGPTGCGKTRFIEYMAFKLHRPLTIVREVTETDENSSSGGLPLGTGACHVGHPAPDPGGR